MQQTYCNVLMRQQKLPKQLKDVPEVTLLTCAVSYLIKGLVKQPDKMSASLEMASGLYFLEHGGGHGFPSFRSAAIEDSLDRVTCDVDPEAYDIITFMGFKKPGGNTIKSSRQIQGIPPPDRLISPPRTPSPSLLPPPSLVPNQHQWSQQDDNFIYQLLNVHLLHALWRRFPADFLRTVSARTRAAKSRPLSLSDWDTLVEHTGQYRVVEGKYPDVLSRLFPENWKPKTKVVRADMQALDDDVWQRVRSHLDTLPPAHRAKYDATLRSRLKEGLRDKWGYLPLVMTHKIWTCTAANTITTFVLCTRS